jgi:hypothetical protein
MDQTLTKKQLIDTMRVERARWEMLLLRVGRGRMSAPVEGVGRSVVELVSAVYERERWLIERLSALQRLPTPFAEAQSPERGRDRHSYPIEASRTAFNEILRLLIPVSEPDLFDAGRLPWTRGRCLAEVVWGCTISFYVEHDPSVRSWLSRPLVQAV